MKKHIFQEQAVFPNLTTAKNAHQKVPQVFLNNYRWTIQIKIHTRSLDGAI